MQNYRKNNYNLHVMLIKVYTKSVETVKKCSAATRRRTTHLQEFKNILQISDLCYFVATHQARSVNVDKGFNKSVRNLKIQLWQHWLDVRHQDSTVADSRVCQVIRKRYTVPQRVEIVKIVLSKQALSSTNNSCIKRNLQAMKSDK